MRTRTSNRTKKYTLEKYDFESSSDNEDTSKSGPSASTPRRRKKAADDDDDENFDASALNDSANEDDEIIDIDDEEAEAPEADGDSEDAAAATATPRRKARIKKPSSSKHARVQATGYIDVEAVATDSHVKSYMGAFDRGMRGQTLIQTWYGPRAEDIGLAQQILDRWVLWSVLPPRYVPREKGMNDRTPWASDFLEREARFAEQWKARLDDDKETASMRYRALGGEEAAKYQMGERGMPLLMGPYDTQKETVFQPGDACALSQGWIPYDADDTAEKIPTGWMFDAGGVVIGMDWAPGRGRDAVQLLALAVIPHSDQEDYDYEAEHQKPDFQLHGTVQIWAFEAGDMDGIQRPSSSAPQLRKTICLDYGRARRVRWSPACNHLAILCGDGRVCVIEVDENGDGTYDKVEQPLASFNLENEASVKASSMAWATFNRLAVGYSDGSIALWSLHPNCLLSRHPVHHSLVVDIATGYPSLPYLVASTPLGGTTKLIDLSRPTYETTEVQTNAVSWQPNLLAWSDHLQGFFSVYPSANALNTMVGFMHHRHFPVVRRIFIGESYNSCLAVGRTHPFLLIGTTDGSLWCMNPQVDLFNSRRELTDRLRLFQHEHRPKALFPDGSAPSVRGVSRILHGFAIEKGRNPKAEIKTQQAAKRPKKTKKSAADAPEGNEEDETGGMMDPTRGIVYEPLSRITTAEWNPNEGFGCWAAAAMASGLVRVIDLGLDNGLG